MGKISGGGREEAPTIGSRRVGVISGVDLVVSEGKGGFGGLILDQVKFILDFPFEGCWSL